MRPMSIACAVAVIIACVCALQSAALPSEVRLDPEVRLEEPEDSEAARSIDQGVAAALAKETSPEVLFRTKRQSHLSLCRYCCNCCKNKGCGFCCRF
uniref:Hepcidin n=1 Tax=Ictalurus punctatus TaxID=7998 RepID=Q3YMZ8_ICTPU|nr:hepcidin precursor [Ictalurus punctatus]AAY59889.1 hepcidin [Ictalurus punctatus]ABA43709.1 hepcidin [Ictalurus punctatus]